MGYLLKHPFGDLNIVAPGNLAPDSLTGGEADNCGQMHHRFRARPIYRQRGADGARLPQVGFKEMKARVGEICQQGFSAKQQIIYHGDMLSQPQQFSSQHRTDVSCTTGDQHVAFRRIFWKLALVVHSFSSICKVTFKPFTNSTGAFLSVTTWMFCSRQVSLQTSAISLA